MDLARKCSGGQVPQTFLAEIEQPPWGKKIPRLAHVEEHGRRLKLVEGLEK